MSTLTEKEQQLAKKAMNDFTEAKGLGRPEEVARQWSEKQFVATAKDTLPQLFKEGNFKTINSQMQNFSKDPESTKAFVQELGYSLKGMKVSDAKTLWTNIGPSVNKFLIKDPEQIKKITNMIDQAKDQKAINRAAALMIKSGYGASQALTERD